ncbi:MAG: beta-1,6-N-acetylglucosaminyltransferase [Bacilli bacterium]
MKIAYLLLAHHNPNQLVRLINKLNNGAASFIIHYDLGSEPKEFNFLKGVFKEEKNVYFVDNRKKGYWGDFSIVNATLECIKFLLNEKVDFDYAFLLSGQDFPLKTNSEIHEFISQNNGKEFIHAQKMPTPFWKNGGMDRLEYYHFNSFKKNGITIKKISFKITTKLLIKFRVKRKLPNIEFYGGSQWWCLSSGFINYALEYINANERFADFFKFTNVPDEMFFQTLIMNSPFKDCVSITTLSYIDWNRVEKPAIFRETDFDLLISRDHLFARKFDEKIDQEILELLDRHISEKEKLQKFGSIQLRIV